MGVDKVVLNSAGVRRLLKETALPEIERRANAVADAYGPDAIVDVSTTRTRARASVTAFDPKRLLKALEAGRD